MLEIVEVMNLDYTDSFCEKNIDLLGMCVCVCTDFEAWIGNRPQKTSSTSKLS